jgi:hypothetical protein
MNWRGALRAATIALVATAAGAATPPIAGAQDLSCEPGDLEVRDLDFRGNSAFDDDDLALQVVTTPSSWQDGSCACRSERSAASSRRAASSDATSST